MRSITSADAKNNFGELIDLARAAPVMVTKYDRPVTAAVSPIVRTGPSRAAISTSLADGQVLTKLRGGSPLENWS
ncbi:MAG: type II toxin-antitoxin system Phd/YefM family antitoxin [Gammaproteobacteria bacterium]|nr:type II toxin-antitoxin system Phd/YefM family antitoxin [Alphaproteobacteria bacterium]MBM4115357.1 type II toxin-antitoxin system Phd/YefM family antitoxin [Phycisphaerae bacterium]MBM4224434.1 type II toxin-antitoxin system Phd/YefM family antitoxin [Gammaproteobacteria bacterium]